MANINSLSSPSFSYFCISISGLAWLFCFHKESFLLVKILNEVVSTELIPQTLGTGWELINHEECQLPSEIYSWEVELQDCCPVFISVLPTICLAFILLRTV